MKQMILMRTDLNMSQGKMVAQGAHAAVTLAMAEQNDPRLMQWFSEDFAQICVGVGSREELGAYIHQALQKGLLVMPIVDDDKTEFGGVKTLTCAAIGPDTEENLDPIYGHLKLL